MPTGEIATLIWALLGIGVVLYATFLTSRYISKKVNLSNRSRMMKVLDVMPLNKDNSIYLVKIGEENIALSVSSSGARMITRVDENEFSIADSESNRPLIARLVGGARSAKLAEDLVAPREHTIDEENVHEIADLKGPVLNITQNRTDSTEYLVEIQDPRPAQIPDSKSVFANKSDKINANSASASRRAKETIEEREVESDFAKVFAKAASDISTVSEEENKIEKIISMTKKPKKTDNSDARQDEIDRLLERISQRRKTNI